MKADHISLVVGGCRSGKSRYALEMAEKVDANRQIFIATCQPHDDEMRERVEKHRQQRSDTWLTVEAPLKLPEAIGSHASPDTVVVVDCLTLWISNILLQPGDTRANDWETQAVRLVKGLSEANGPVILVSNEVGTGIVPENRLARMFRDATGAVNQQVAAVAGSVIWMVAGIPVKIK